ncbi:MAG: hypothetical protein GXY83_21385 [Rhodopirellula sp.]|nr:hypothetical protein [Rhodopirellula sp.]
MGCRIVDLPPFQARAITDDTLAYRFKAAPLQFDPTHQDMVDREVTAQHRSDRLGRLPNLNMPACLPPDLCG